MKESERKLAEDIVRRRDEMHSALLDRYDEHLYYYDLWRSVPIDSPENDDDSNLFIPITFAKTEFLTARHADPFVNALKPWFTMKGEDSFAHEAREQNRRREWAELQKMKIGAKIFHLKHLAAIYGTSIGVLGFTRKFGKRKKVKRQPAKFSFMGMNLGIPNLEQWFSANEEALEYEGVTLTVLDHFCFVKDEWSNSFYDENGLPVIDECGYWYYDTLDNLKDNANFKNLDEVKEVDWSQDPKVLERQEATGVNDMNFSRKCVKIYRRWKRHPDGYRTQAVANDEILILDEDNPFPFDHVPLIRCIHSPDEHSFWGIGVPELLDDLQREINKKRNRRIDNVDMCMDRMILAEEGAIPDGNIEKFQRQAKRRRGGIIKVLRAAGIQQWTWNDVTSNAYQEEALCKGDADEVTFVTNYVSGTASSSREPTSSVQTKISQASIPFSVNAKLGNEETLVPLLQMVWKCIQYFDLEKHEYGIDVGGGEREFYEFDPIAAQGDYSFEITVDPGDIMSAMKVAQFEDWLNIIGKSPWATRLNGDEVIKYSGELFDIRPIDRFLLPPPPPIAAMPGLGLTPPGPGMAPPPGGGVPMEEMPMGNPMEPESFNQLNQMGVMPGGFASGGANAAVR